MNRIHKLGLIAVVLVVGAYVVATRTNINPARDVGSKIDEFNGVAVYYNGAINNTSGRFVTADGYNIGLKYQCVEFVKRYYYERFGHKMPNAMGHAKEFFSHSFGDGELNTDRMLLQYRNESSVSPAIEDIVVFAPWLFNRYGHVAIVSQVGEGYVEIVQQNPGPFGSSRERLPLVKVDGKYRIESSRVLGWLRKQQSNPSLNRTL